ncbi:unnamed protein product [Ambrosiozyma monospora]|uniref:Unnamed protein product n=1 Tax=Ambrosiozyma monospora TaxID=43982 RepID=A0ACB5TAL2_AMBMO|nr:unnamed protein product [Ambrosiozyma monospora]
MDYRRRLTAFQNADAGHDPYNTPRGDAEQVEDFTDFVDVSRTSCYDLDHMNSDLQKTSTCMQFILSLPIAQSLVTPNADSSISDGKTRDDLDEALEIEDRPLDYYVNQLKPVKFVLTGQLNSLLNPALKEKYERYLENVDYTIFDYHYVKSLPRDPQ